MASPGCARSILAKTPATSEETVDDRPFGGGPGMVMAYAPLRRCLDRVVATDPAVKPHVIALSPQGTPLKQATLVGLARRPRVVLLCGRYEGIDQRFVDKHVDEELSIGDYVLSGGELPAAVLIDGVVRLLPGALGKAASAEQDSFMDGLLDCPHYTRPETIGDEAVPEVLLSGDHAAIARWRRQQALGLTWRRRPDLLAGLTLSETDRQLLLEFIDAWKARSSV